MRTASGLRSAPSPFRAPGLSGCRPYATAREAAGFWRAQRDWREGRGLPLQVQRDHSDLRLLNQSAAVGFSGGFTPSLGGQASRDQVGMPACCLLRSAGTRVASHSTMVQMLGLCGPKGRPILDGRAETRLREQSRSVGRVRCGGLPDRRGRVAEPEWDQRPYRLAARPRVLSADRVIRPCVLRRIPTDIALAQGRSNVKDEATCPN